MAQEYFELPKASPYMTFVAPVLKSRRLSLQEKDKNKFGIDSLNIPRSDIPAVTHVDNSARIQTVSRKQNPFYYDIIKAFYKKILT